MGPPRKNLLRVCNSGVWPESAAFAVGIVPYANYPGMPLVYAVYAKALQNAGQKSADRPPLGNGSAAAPLRVCCLHATGMRKI